MTQQQIGNFDIDTDATDTSEYRDVENSIFGYVVYYIALIIGSWYGYTIPESYRGPHITAEHRKPIEKSKFLTDYDRRQSNSLLADMAYLPSGHAFVCPHCNKPAVVIPDKPTIVHCKHCSKDTDLRTTWPEVINLHTMKILDDYLKRRSEIDRFKEFRR